MAKRNSKGPPRERFIEETLTLIAEKGGSKDVNLREISRRVGCAHTNAYNYFNNMDDLLWAAFKRALLLYAEAITAGLEDSLSGYKYFDRLISNMVDFAVGNPGLYRFIGSDPLTPESIPEEIVEIITGLKLYYLKVFRTLTKGTVTRAKADHAGNTILAYMDGEIFNLINGRYLPDEQVRGRIIGNIHQLFTLLTSKSNDGIVLRKAAGRSGEIAFPELKVSNLFEGRTS
ncbi:MAG: TetR/AcrR family transcriptional regulator [Deltaproteobacteria bacterium]|nr:TetR/AcrR family transcriptional regulator [Deltaproteobacteria bacterium]